MLTKALINESVFLSVRNGSDLNDYLFLVLRYAVTLPVILLMLIIDVIISPLELITYILYRKGNENAKYNNKS